MAKQVHLFGIRHHGPGSARAVLRALDEVQPQAVLIEGPPDADQVIHSAASAAMRPPVALLVYRADDAKQAVYYPFAEFSPEWCAMRWALAREVPVRFMDLPQSYRMAREAPGEEKEEELKELLSQTPAAAPSPAASPTATPPADSAEAEEPPLAALARMRSDPLDELAHAAGFDDGERWWEHTFEHRRQPDTQTFAAIAEAIAALREGEIQNDAALLRGRDDPLREAWMRRTIRESQRTSNNIAVVCGAWHVPALAADAVKSLKKEDDAALKSLAKVKTVATWIPWTFNRLSTASGYGAGIHAPGWYEHLWQSESHLLERWMTRVGRMLRSKDIDCSSAHVIEATRLAESLAAMRSRPLADLSDIADACRAVFCFDSDVAMRLIARELLIGERLGEVPEDTPLAPLQQDLQSQQKRLRLKAEAQDKVLDLDLRNDNDRARSELLHRLRLLGIDWGTPQSARGGKGTFHEVWQLSWMPEFLVRLIEYGVWGNTIESAATAFIAHRAAEARDLEQLTQLLCDAMLANVPAAVSILMQGILTTAAVGADVAKLMDAFPPLSEVARYGNVRQTDKEFVGRVIDGVLPRIIVGLVPAVTSLADEAAREMDRRITRVHEAVQLIEAPELAEEWFSCLARVSDQATAHGLIRGRGTRLMFDAGKVSGDDVASRLSLMLSRGTDPTHAAAWVEGFLSTSGLVLLHHEQLLAIVDEWLVSIPADVFTEQVPLLRRTFSGFAPAERRQIGTRLQAGMHVGPRTENTANQAVNERRAAKVLPLLRILFGTQSKEPHHDG